MEYISNFFHFYETIDSFEAHKRQNVINPDSICFIKESSQIYTQGTLFGICKSRFESIENMVKEHEIILKNILGDEGPSVPTSTIDNLKDIIEFLSGFTTDDNLKVIVENIIETVKTEVSVITAELSQKVNSVIDTVNGLQPQIDSLRSNIAAQNSVIELINNRTDATQRTVVLLQDSFESLRTYVNGVSNNVDNRLSQMEATIRSMNSMINDINTDIMQIEKFMSDIRDDISSSATNSEEALRVATEANQKATNLVNSKGQPEGIAPINDLGKIPDNFIPEWANSVQMEESVTYFPSTGENNILYIDTSTKIQYRWDGSKYTILYDPSTSADAIEALDTKTTEAIAAANTLITAESNRAKESEAILEESLDDLTTSVTSINNKIGANEGIATLDSYGKVPSAQLPSYVDDVLEYATRAAFPTTGETGKIYVSLDDNLTYRWSGSTYIEISKSLGLGETATTAYPGNKGKKNADDIAAHKADTNNPHSVTKAQLGLDKVNNTSDEDKPVSTAQAAAIKVVQDDLTGHKGNKANPHEVTKAQVGLSNVDNTSDLDKPISNATQAALDVLDTSLDTHIADKTNPHNVTKEQLGLGNVENTADKDKPVSDAVQNVLDTKVDKIIGKGLSTNDFTNEDKSKLDNSMSNRKLSTEEINELTSKNVGDLIYNITINKYVYWNGTSWEEVGDTDLSNYVTKDELEAMDALVDTKVDKVAGKELSSNDFTDEYKGILDNPWGETIE